jgi:hypothetical protein
MKPVNTKDLFQTNQSPFGRAKQHKRANLYSVQIFVYQLEARDFTARDAVFLIDTLCKIPKNNWF